MLGTRAPSESRLRVSHSRLVSVASCGKVGQHGDAAGRDPEPDGPDLVGDPRQPALQLDHPVALRLVRPAEGPSVKANRGGSPMAARCARHHSH